MSNRYDNEVLDQEEHPLPSTVHGIAEAVRNILEAEGRCQRIVIDLDHPIRVQRWVAPHELSEVNVDLDGALRNSTMVEYINPNEDKTPAEVLFHMTHLLRMESCHPVCWVAGASRGYLRKWLEMDEVGLSGELKEVFFIPVHRLETLPRETLVLAGSPYADSGIKDISVAVKTVIEERKRDAKVVDGNDGGSGNHPRRNAAAVRAMEDPPGRDGGEAWTPSSFIRERLGRGSKIR